MHRIMIFVLGGGGGGLQFFYGGRHFSMGLMFCFSCGGEGGVDIFFKRANKFPGRGGGDGVRGFSVKLKRFPRRRCFCKEGDILQ